LVPEALGLLDTLPCGFVSFTDDSRIRAVNRTLAARLGSAPEELIGRPFEQTLPIASKLFHQTHFFPLVRMQGEVREIFLLMRTKSGEEIGMLCNARRRLENDVYYTDCVLLEVTERRKYEDALLDARRTAEDANQKLEEQAVELEMQHQQLQEQATELEVQSDALQTLNDDLMTHSAALELAQKAADSANKAKSEFLATMSHELRTPLNAIGGYADLLRTGVYGPLAATQTDALDRLLRAQRHLLGLINDVLNLARMESGRVEYRIAEVHVPPVVDELTAMIEPQITTKGQQFEVSVPDQDLCVRADHEKLVQILLNLLGNAVKFTPAGGTISLSAEALDDVARFQVVDTGRGIPADKQRSIFEPFVQVRADPNKPNEGTGLGLAISRNLALGMGGDITVTSDIGKGSTFVLTLPRSA
jgi:PAS domain S-box-containing protein